MYTARSLLNKKGLKKTLINEHLTKQHSCSFYRDKILVRKHKIVSYSTADGVILVKEKG
jgi:hypothetical protein